MSFSFESIIHNINDAIFIFDLKKRLVFLNKAAEEYIGKDFREIKNKKVSEIFLKKEIESLIKKTIEEGRSFNYWDFEFDTNRAANVDISCSPFYPYSNDVNKNSEIQGALLCIRERSSLAEREDDSFDPLPYMIGSIAHEIKNPLSGIKGAAQILKEINNSDDAKECIDLIIRESDRLNSVLSNYLTMTKTLVFNRINIHEILEYAILVMQTEIKKNKINISRLYDLSLPQLLGDEGKLLQVFINIIRNSLDAMKESKKRVLKIFTKLSDEYVVIYRDSRRDKAKKRRWIVVGFEDTGVGIPKSDIDKIFLPFYTKKDSGIGLGLALSKKIIKDHNGTIKVKSDLGKGATFNIYLPVPVKGS
jgi:PAS domain S-box-containing protein